MTSHEHKAVALLRLLGADVQAALMSNLESAQAARLRERLSDGTSVLPARKQLQLLEEFERLIAVAEPLRPPLRLHRPGGDDPTGMESSSAAKPRSTVAERFAPSGDHLADLERINVFQVAAAFQAEQPRSIAAVLTQLSPERTAELLSLFDETRREAVVRELSATARTHPLLVERMAEAILACAVTMPPEAPAPTDRLQQLAAVLRAVERPLRRRMLEAIGEQDPATADALLERLYEFNDLAKLQDRQVQKLLTEVDTATISTALSGAEESLREKVLSNLSRRARESLLEEMSFQSEIPERLVAEARKGVASAIARMDTEE
ncbi:MAG: hypothetical protein KDA75_03610 [Planctomycetaceae bacterium]|nr:hypothetical protein [Planctomycetaceae bacterium]